MSSTSPTPTINRFPPRSAPALLYDTPEQEAADDAADRLEEVEERRLELEHWNQLALRQRQRIIDLQEYEATREWRAHQAVLADYEWRTWVGAEARLAAREEMETIMEWRAHRAVIEEYEAGLAAEEELASRVLTDLHDNGVNEVNGLGCGRWNGAKGMGRVVREKVEDWGSVGWSGVEDEN